MMKLEAEIVNEYAEKDNFYKNLSFQEQILYKIAVRDTLEFRKYLLRKRIEEFINLLFSKTKHTKTH